MSDLRDWSDKAVARYERPTEPDADLEDDEEAEAETPSEAGADFDAWVESLSPEDLARATADPAWRASAFGWWQTRQGVSFAPPAQDEPDDAGDEVPPQTGGEVVAWVMQNAASVRRDHGMTPAQFLASLAGASRTDWARFAAEAGIPLSAKPSYSDIGRAGQAALVRADVAKWTAADFRK